MKLTSNPQLRGSHQQTLNTIAANMSANLEVLESLPANDPARAVIRARNTELNQMIVDVALMHLKQITLQVIANELVQEIANASGDAKKEAARIKNATDKVKKLGEAFDKLTKVVSAFGKLLA